VPCPAHAHLLLIQCQCHLHSASCIFRVARVMKSQRYTINSAESSVHNIATGCECPFCSLLHMQMVNLICVQCRNDNARHLSNTSYSGCCLPAKKWPTTHDAPRVQQQAFVTDYVHAAGCPLGLCAYRFERQAAIRH
jgi:hypothetical protein